MNQRRSPQNQKHIWRLQNSEYREDIAWLQISRLVGMVGVFGDFPGVSGYCKCQISLDFV